MLNNSVTIFFSGSVFCLRPSRANLCQMIDKIMSILIGWSERGNVREIGYFGEYVFTRPRMQTLFSCMETAPQRVA